MLRPLCFFIVGILLACNDKPEEKEGGPCTYATKIYPATVIYIEILDSLHAEIVFKVNDDAGQVYRDSVSWYMENKNWVELSQIEKDSIAIGKKYQYKVDMIKTGSCNPTIEILTLEKFSAK